jgi:E3 SUMO-protein ligase PIAS1
MVFCSSDNRGRQDITFPHQSEIKVNGGEIKANLRGLKNKAGSTRPVDITKELRLKMASYSNNVEMTYALTSKVDKNIRVSFLNLQIAAWSSIVALLIRR